MTSQNTQPEKPVGPVTEPTDGAQAPPDLGASGRSQDAPAGPPAHGVDDPETTAVRRQSFLRLPDTPAPTAQDGEARDPAGPAPEPPVRPAGTASVPAHTEPDTGVLLAGASVEPGPPSRAAAHWWGVVLSLLLAPLGWYLVTDAGARLTLPAAGPWATGRLNAAALGELIAGLAVLGVVLLTARWSSVGVILTGAVVLLAGVPFLAFPSETREYVEPLVDQLWAVNDLAGNAAHHVVADGATGRFVLYGLALVLTGVVSHGARRSGRREEKARSDQARNRQLAGPRPAEGRSAQHRGGDRPGSAGTPG